MSNKIDMNGLYRVTFKNGVTSVVLGKSLLFNNLDTLNVHTVDHYVKIKGSWFDVKFDGIKLWAVYAENQKEAIEKRMEDLVNLNKADLSRLTATLSDFNDKFQ